MPSYLGTESGSGQPKPDEVKMVLYSRGVWNALFFIGCYWRTDVCKNGRSPGFYFIALVEARRDQRGGLALPESCRGCCRSRYDAKKTKSAMKIVHHWGPTLMHLGCMIEMACWKGHGSIKKHETRMLFHLLMGQPQLWNAFCVRLWSWSKRVRIPVAQWRSLSD